MGRVVVWSNLQGAFVMRDRFLLLAFVFGVNRPCILFERLLRKALVIVCQIDQVRAASRCPRTDRVFFLLVLAWPQEDQQRGSVRHVGIYVRPFLHGVIVLVVDNHPISVSLQVRKAEAPSTIGVRTLNGGPMQAQFYQDLARWELAPSDSNLADNPSEYLYLPNEGTRHKQCQRKQESAEHSLHPQEKRERGPFSVMRTGPVKSEPS